MDESFMSTNSFDEESFLTEAFNSTNQNFTEKSNISNEPNKSIDITGLLKEPLEELPKSKLEFNDVETPRNSGVIKRQRKRKNITRRCLSTDLNADFSLNSEDDQLSFQQFRQSKEIKKSHEGFFNPNSQNILSSIENRSPNKNNPSCENLSFELTPEFDTHKKFNTIANKVIARVPLKVNNQSGGVPFQRCFSENHASIKRALQVSSSDPTLIGDFSKPFILPLLANSKHQDLKSISCHVLADVLKGFYNNVIESCTIIDCRYPYEFDGGHIMNALNLYTQEHILAHFIANKSKEAETCTNHSKRNILIFHCEFSSERGPSLCRFLRNKDRVKNSRVYPSLYYPEIYLLEGGYKDFYTSFSILCQPCAYMPMHSKEHEEDLRKFRALVKSHSFDSKFSTHKRNLRL